MDYKEIELELGMTYADMQQYLLHKYGGATCDYFVTPECKSKGKSISRTSEGLYCHHMDEDKGGNLGNPSQAKMQPFAWQKIDRLVYCNILEHLILHMKIAVLRQHSKLKVPHDVISFFTTGGIFMICMDINDMFMSNGTNVVWKRRCFNEVKENFEDYITLINAFLLYIDKNYIGSKTEKPFFAPGSIIHFPNVEYEIIRISKENDLLLLGLPSGERKVVKLTEVYDRFAPFLQLTYADQVDYVIRGMSSGFEGIHTAIYRDIVAYDKKEVIINWQEKFGIDFRGYGFPQYAYINLDKSFGSENADEYISKALPMYCSNRIDLSGKTPRFWKGTPIPTSAKDLFYIIRIKTSFKIKAGMEPFVRYRETDALRSQAAFAKDNNHGFAKNWTVLKTSDIYDPVKNKYYSVYEDTQGNVAEARVILSLGRDDFLLFKKTYTVWYMEILDGCYFY